MQMRSFSAAIGASVSWVARHLRVGAILLLVLGAVLAVAQSAGSSGGGDAKKEQSAFDLTPSVGGSRAAGTAEEPTAAGSLLPSHSVTALAVDDGLGGFAFTYSYTPSVAAYNNTVLTAYYDRYHFGGPTFPPFGRSPKNPDAQHFWHNLYSFMQVRLDKCPPAAETGCIDEISWVLRTPGGQSITVEPCVFGTGRNPDPLGQPACITDHSSDESFAPGERLAWDGQGFVYYTPSARYYYRQRLGGSTNGGGTPSYYLSWVEDAQYGDSDSGRRKKVSLTYGLPTGCTTDGWTDSAGYPVEATLFNGSRLTLSYKKLPATYPGAALDAKECVLASVDLVSPSGDGGIGAQQVASFAYTSQSLDGGTREVAGLLTGTTLGIQGSVLDYVYGQDGTSWSVYRDGRAVTQKTYNFYLADGGTTSAPETGSFFTKTDWGEDRTWTIGDRAAGFDAYSYSQTFGTPQASRGDGSGQPATLVERVYLSTQGAGSLLVTGRTSTCYDTAACGTNANYARWSFATVNGYTVSAGEQTQGSSWTQYQYADAGTTDGGYFGLRYAPELTRVETGKTSLISTSYASFQNRAFVYLDSPRTGEQNAAEQHVKTVSTASLLDASQVVQRRVYEMTTGRVKAVFVTGRTRNLDAATGTTSLVTRTIGTFYRTAVGPTGAADPFGRTLEQVGPCDVAAFDQAVQDDYLPTDCAQPATGTVPVPIVRLAYYADGQGNNSRRLMSSTRYPLATLSASGTLALGAGLTTTYESYDVLGHPTRVRDENGGVTESLYSGVRLIQTSVLKPGFESDAKQTAVTKYEYENGLLRRMQKPDGDWEVYCYRSNADAACTGQLTGHLQWKATAYQDDKTAAHWFEKTTYSYRYGQLVSEKAFDSTGAVRREVRYEPDPLGRQTFQQVGTTSGEYVANAKYGLNGVKKAFGEPYNRTPPLCTTPGSYDPTCTEDPPVLDENGKPLPSAPATCPVATVDPSCHAWSYDTLGRLTKLLEPVGEGLPQAATCVTYDARGNLKSLSRGAGSCSSQADATFEYDDFGNLLSLTAVWLGTSGSPGTVRFGYDARGNLVKKQTPAMAAASPKQWLEYAYDAAGRMTSATAAGGTASPVLYKLWYDTSVPSGDLCTGAYPDLTANTKGRLQAREDSFGTTFYSYDHLGRMTKQVRRRKGAGCTPSNPTRDYLVSTAEYDAGGRLLNETYPHGRKLLYAYHNASASEGLAPSSRVKSISMLKYVSATQPGAEVPLLSDIRWEPYGRMRSYRVNTALAGTGKTEALVEYLTGNNTASLRTCADGRPDGASDGTGRLAGLWVSRGEDTNKTGGILKRSYLWQADQLTEQATCFLRSSGTPQTERFGYDRSLRLTSATRPSGNFAATGAAWGKREYAFAATGARLKDTQDCWEFTNSNEGSTDRVLARTATGNQCAGVCRAYGLSTTFAYDADGRASAKTVLDAQGGQASRLTFDAALDGQAAVGAVFRSITVKRGSSQSTYSYYYDSFGRRRLKQYPINSLSDEYFYDGERLLEDQGNNDLNSASGNFVLDEYVWLDGKPVALLKSRLKRDATGTWTRDGDDVVAGDTAACARNGEPATCGTYFIVNDYLGKPVLMLNAQRQVTGVADYDPFGYVNRVSYLGQARATSAPSSLVATIGYFTQPILAQETSPDGSKVPLEEVHLRARFANVDTDNGATDFAYLTEKSGTAGTPGLTLAGTVATSNASVGGAGLGPTQTSWVKMPPSGQVHVRFKSDGAADSSRLGVTLEGYEYRRFQAGASWVWTPLRFPGQYHDAETDLFENWNRYYDPSVGRYLAPDPLGGSPSQIVQVASDGKSNALYSYALSNPVYFTDRDGREFVYLDSSGNGISASSSSEDLMSYFMALETVEKLKASSNPVVSGMTAMLEKSDKYVIPIYVGALGAGQSNGRTRDLQSRYGIAGSQIELRSAHLIRSAYGARVGPDGRPYWASISANFASTLAHEIGHAAYNAQLWMYGYGGRWTEANSNRWAMMFGDDYRAQVGMELQLYHPLVGAHP